MKIKNLIVAGTIMLSVATFAQKDELKTLKKLYAKDFIKGEDLATYKATISKLETLATEEGDKVYTNFYKTMLPFIEMNNLGPNPNPVELMKLLNPTAITNFATGLNTTLEYEAKTGKKVYTDDINETVAGIKPALWQMVVAYDGMKKHKETADVLYATYTLDKKEKEKLYYAANYYIQAQENDKALECFQTLKKEGYTGEGTAYYATNKETKKEDLFNTKEERNLFVQSGTHEKPRDEKIPSKKGEIVKNIALILVEKGKTDEAKAAFLEARKENPNDVGLIIEESNMYYRLKDMKKYQELVNEALAKNPNDHELIYNLGVVSAEAGNYTEAEKYYNKVIQLKPDYYNAYLNLSDLKLKPDAKIVKEMNALGTSDKDMKRYEVLKADRQKIFNEALPLLEKAYELKPDDEVVKSNLMSVYNFLEMTDKYKALKAKK
ncbi:tetratricopeptide repeat protein [Flavobacterium croceum]|uniref:tetratricopeptide repeat protein n=1 Tax=Flavobacterium croceum TaxID=370975 RepID=UPI0024A862F4|nr:tetratricopeptide repeat protein [Flavobacterium croceum]